METLWKNIDYVVGITAASLLLIGFTILYCSITVKREQNKRKVNNESAIPNETIINATELPPRSLNSRTTCGNARPKTNSSIPYFLRKKQKTCSVEYVLHDPNKSVVIQNTYENCC